LPREILKSTLKQSDWATGPLTSSVKLHLKSFTCPNYLRIDCILSIKNSKVVKKKSFTDVGT